MVALAANARLAGLSTAAGKEPRTWLFAARRSCANWPAACAKLALDALVLHQELEAVAVAVAVTKMPMLGSTICLAVVAAARAGAG